MGLWSDVQTALAEQSALPRRPTTNRRLDMNDLRAFVHFVIFCSNSVAPPSTTPVTSTRVREETRLDGGVLPTALQCHSRSSLQWGRQRGWRAGWLFSFGRIAHRLVRGASRAF